MITVRMPQATKTGDDKICIMIGRGECCILRLPYREVAYIQLVVIFTATGIQVQGVGVGLKLMKERGDEVERSLGIHEGLLFEINQRLTFTFGNGCQVNVVPQLEGAEEGDLAYTLEVIEPR